jgi:hypothetical protein
MPGDPSLSADVLITQSDPLPLTVLGLVARLETNAA